MEKNKQNWGQQGSGDRFIPTRVRTCAFQVDSGVPAAETDKSSYEQLLERNILGSVENNLSQRKIMSFGVKNNETGEKEGRRAGGERKVRRISKQPYKVLHAPNLQDDFYLNLVDWSSSNEIAVALDTSLYIWSGCFSEVSQLYETSHMSDYICSVAFCGENKVSIGNSLGQIKVFDIVKRKILTQFDGHQGRVGSLSWNSGLLASGARNGTVATWDLRDGLISYYQPHSQEICGLKWSPQGNYIASGGNDNKLVVYSAKKGGEMVRFHEHRGAVKAIGWCPSNASVLVSGGGTDDRHIRFFSTHTMKQNHAIETGAQVCNLAFSTISNELVSTHGYSLNQINVWDTDNNWERRSVRKVATLTGHTYRVLYLALSPSGDSIMTGAGDQTLRFWKVFESQQFRKEERLNFTVDLR